MNGGAGFTIRNHLGELVAAGLLPVEASETPGTELRALWEGLRYGVHTLKARGGRLNSALLVIQSILRLMAQDDPPLLLDCKLMLAMPL